MSALKLPINYKSLEEELHAALAVDELYKLQNDAKIRAVEQGVPTYEHFRQMVNGAHLKPLDRGDMKPKIGTQWNTMINTVISRDTVTSTVLEKRDEGEINENITKRFPEIDFLQSWRKITDNTEKFTYMWDLRNHLQNHIFRVEIPASFLGDFINVCLQHLSNVDDITPITELLDILTECNRFELTAYFMTRDERSVCEQLFQQLQLKGSSQEKSSIDNSTIESLAAKYRITLN